MNIILILHPRNLVPRLSAGPGLKVAAPPLPTKAGQNRRLALCEGVSFSSSIDSELPA
jgi:hypothetical protein